MDRDFAHVDDSARLSSHMTGVLIYLLMVDRAVEIVADLGIDAKVDAQEWSRVCRQMEAAFGQSNFEGGVVCGVQAVTQRLVQHFPADTLWEPWKAVELATLEWVTWFNHYRVLEPIATLYVTDHGKAVDLKGASAKLTLLSTSAKSELALQPAGDKLEGKGSLTVSSGTKVIAVVTQAGKVPVTVKFTLR